MKLLGAVLFTAVSVIANGSAVAQPMTQDDLKWINQCIQDNRGEGAKPPVVRAYCICMNEKMDTKETRSISEWEKANPTAMRACERQSGWK